MHLELRFGQTNKPKKNAQSLWVRIKHNNLDWNKSLRIKINSDEWNFKKREIITSRAVNDPIYSKHLKEISQTIYELTKYLQYISEKHSHSNYMELKQWVKNKERKRFIDLCDKWYSDYNTENAVITQPYFMEAFEECRLDLENTTHNSLTSIRWKTLGENIQSFMDYSKRNIRTDEFSQKVWTEMLSYFKNEYKHRDKTGNVGLSDYSILTILKKIKAVKNHFPNKYIFHSDIDRLKVKVKKKVFDTLNEEELNQFFMFQDDTISFNQQLRDEIKQWFFKIQYYGCFRISEVYKNLYKNPEAKFPKLKTPREIYENEVYTSKDAKGNEIKVWKCYHAKDDGGGGNKNLPIHSALAEALFGADYELDGFDDYFRANGVKVDTLYTEQSQRRYMKETLKKLGIDKKIASHEIRKSFLTNERKKGIQKSDLMQYSGHTSEEAFNLYINDRDNYIPTQVDLY